MPESLKLSKIFSVSPATLYNAWMNSLEHSAFTGAKASIDAHKNGKFTAWDGYISGRTIELKPHSSITQIWRTSEFPSDAPDSLLEIHFEKLPKGTRLTLKHTMIPEGQAEDYKKGWKDFYFKPMMIYFGK